MVLILPAEFRAPSKCEQKEYDGEEYDDEEDLEGVVAQLSLQSQQAMFDKPSQHQHLKALYMKGFINGKPMTKMLVGAGTAVNLMPYTTFCKLGKAQKI
jgi:hypothetical protein